MASTFAVSDDVKKALLAAEIEDVAPFGSQARFWRVRLVEKLDRKHYVAVNKVLEAAGGKWSRAATAHVFDRDPRETLGLAIETGKATNRKQELQAFYSPPAVADRVVELAEIEPGMSVLEPSVGPGALVEAIERRGALGAISITAYDLDHVALQRLAEIHLSQRSGPWKVECRNFLEVAPGEDFFDRVVMNPPFTKGAALEHVLHAYSFLVPGGRLVAVMPGGVGPSGATYTASSAIKRAFGELLLVALKLRENLPEGSFRESGTDARTHLIVLEKPVSARRRATRRSVIGSIPSPGRTP